jgi:hypothetical protein
MNTVIVFGVVWIKRVVCDVRFKDDSVHPILNLTVFSLAVVIVLLPCLWGLRKTLRSVAAVEKIIEAAEYADAERQIFTGKDRKVEDRDLNDPASNMNINPIMKLWWKEHVRVNRDSPR